MAHIIEAAGLAAAILSSIAIAPAHAAVPGPLALRIAPGQTVQQALFQSRLRVRFGRPDTHTMPVRGSKVFAPAITAGAVVSGTMVVGQAGSIPKLSFTFRTDGAGFSGAEFVFTAPNGSQSLAFDYFPQDYVKAETVTFEPNTNAPYYAQPGQWVLTAATIQDNQFNYTQYDQAQLASLFTNPYVTVVNSGKVDITPPVVTAGQILTPKISLSSHIPVFEASLTGTDDVSGLSQPYVLIEAPGGSYSQVDFYPAPLVKRSGTVDAYSPIFTGQPTGTWSITGYALCDAAGNCFSDQTPADVTALFGTNTFKVVN